MDKQRAKQMLAMTNRLSKIDESTLSPQQQKQHRRMVEAIRSELKALREGASADDVQRAIINRIMVANTDLLAKYGPQKIMDASMEVAEFHAGAEELGTSDISIMVKEVARNLKEQNQEVEEDMSRRGFLRGMAAAAAGAAGLGAAGTAQAGQQDLGNGFVLSTVDVGGETAKAVLDTQSDTYYTLNRRAGGGAIFRSMAPFIMVKDGQVKMAMEVGPQVSAAMKKAKLVGESVEEGFGRQLLAGAALLAALWGVNNNLANDAYNNSPQLQQLIKLHQDAEARNDMAKVKELEQRIQNHKTRLDLGHGEVMGSDGNPKPVREHSNDHNGEMEDIQMAVSDLKNLGHSIESLLPMVQNCDELPAWCSSYITLANDHIQSIKEYMASKQQGEQGEHEITDVNSPAGASDRETYERMHRVFDFSNFKG